MPWDKWHFRISRGFAKPLKPRLRLVSVVVALVLSLDWFKGGVECFSPLWDSVKTQVFQEYEIISARGQISIVRTRLSETQKPDLVVGENVKPNSRLILTCTAWYPAEWVYSGDADPTYTSNTTIENLGHQGQSLPLDEVNGAKRYVATIIIGPRGIKQSDTGRYNCMTASPETGMKYKTLSAYYHLFVPGKTLFIRKRGGTILYDLRKSPARIPCGVTNPKVAVSLQKFQNGNLINVDNETMLYHPISGFYPRHDIPGTYVCTAGHNKAFELLHFTLVPKISDSATIQSIQKSSEENLEWLFNSFKLGQSNRIRLSTKAPQTISSNSNEKLHRPNYGQRPQGAQVGGGGQNSIWNRPNSNSHEGQDQDKKLLSGSNTKPTYRPVYVLFAEDLNKLKSRPSPKDRPSVSSGSGSASTSASVSGSDETDEDQDEDREQEQEEDNDTDGEKEREEESREGEDRESGREPDHQYHFDPNQINTENGPIRIHRVRPGTSTTPRPQTFHREYATTMLPFINFLNPGSAVIKYKPVLDPKESILKRGDSKRTTSKPLGHIVYDLESNRLVYKENPYSRPTTERVVYQESSFTRPATERPVRTTQRPQRFKIPSLPTQRWPTTRRSRPTTRTTTTTTTPPPPLIPDAVVCINSPCGKHATCYANTVYYHKQKETRREPACKCEDKYYGNPYLECHPPTQQEHDFISFNSTGLFEKRAGEASLEDLEEGHLRNSDVFPYRSDEPVIVDAKRKKK